jgi:N-acetylglutamate synthase-like GNAT family acetyltransferase
MVVREAKKEDVGALLGTVYPLIGVPTDYYDIVAARMYEEILGWYRNRTANEFILVGSINGVIAGIVTSRSVDHKLGMSLHTLTIKRGLRVGAQLFAAKMEDHIDYQGADEVYIVAESPIGFKRWMIEYELENRFDSYPSVRHELGGVPTFVLTRKLWEAVKAVKCTGTRPVPPEILATADKLIMPSEYTQIPGFKR